MSGRYQSRLLRTVQTQVQQLQDTLALRWRQLKHSTTWTTQYLLHTLDQLFHSVRRAGFQLKQAAHQGRQLAAAIGKKAVPIDQPIQNVLSAIEVQALPASSSRGGAPVPQHGVGIAVLKPLKAKLPSPLNQIIKVGQSLQKFVVNPVLRRETFKAALTHVSAKIKTLSDRSPALTPVLQIQGVATVLATRRLVLTTPNQEILDILTPVQQRLLHQRIIWEVASYWYERKSNLTKRLGCKLQLPPWVQPLRQLAATPIRLRLPHRRTLSRLKPVGAMVRAIVKHPAPLVPPVPFVNRWRTILAGTVGAIALLPFTLFAAPPARANAAPALPMPISMPLRLEWAADPNRSRKRWLDWGDIFGGQAEVSQGKVQVAGEKSQSKLTSTELQNAIAAWATQFTDPTVSAQRDTIDVKAQAIGYELRFLDGLLKGLDWVLVRLENTLEWLWTSGWPILKQGSITLWSRLLKS
jgi:hypothetical protein